MRITGIVKDQNGSPVEFAVLMDGNGNGATTGMGGEFSFDAASDSIEVQAVGYQSGSFRAAPTMSITLFPNSDLTTFGTIEIFGKRKNISPLIPIGLLFLLLFIAYRMKWLQL
jgi:hypothetical protein